MPWWAALSLKKGSFGVLQARAGLSHADSTDNWRHKIFYYLIINNTDGKSCHWVATYTVSLVRAHINCSKWLFVYLKSLTYGFVESCALYLTFLCFRWDLLPESCTDYNINWVRNPGIGPLLFYRNLWNQWENTKHPHSSWFTVLFGMQQRERSAKWIAI